MRVLAVVKGFASCAKEFTLVFDQAKMSDPNIGYDLVLVVGLQIGDLTWTIFRTLLIFGPFFLN